MNRFDEALLIQSKLPMGIGIALVFPVAFLGTLAIVDYPGPPGPFGFAEFFGWWALCVAIAFCSAHFLLRFRQCHRMRFLFLVLAVALPAALAFLLWADVQPSTPVSVKRIVEYSLQAVGLPAMAALVAFVTWASRKPA